MLTTYSFFQITIKCKFCKTNSTFRGKKSFIYNLFKKKIIKKTFLLFTFFFVLLYTIYNLKHVICMYSRFRLFRTLHNWEKLSRIWKYIYLNLFLIIGTAALSGQIVHEQLQQLWANSVPINQNYCKICVINLCL